MFSKYPYSRCALHKVIFFESNAAAGELKHLTVPLNFPPGLRLD